jgi:hypothetical protein
VLDRALRRRDVFGRAPSITAIACSLKGKLMLGTILLIVLILLLLGALPTWPHSRNWGYYPGGGIGLLLAIIIILLLLGRI